MTWIKMIRDRRGSLVALKAHDSTERATGALLAPSPKRLQGDVDNGQILRAAPRRTHRIDDQALPLGIVDRTQVVVVDHRPCTVEAVRIKWSLVLPGRLPALLSEC